MPDEKKPTTAKTETAPRQYRIVAAGITGANGQPHYRGAVLDAAQVGDDARIAKLLAAGAIEEAT